jgi:2-C-methyl-D-erythritol 4-phosphate cytidylyltransferase/2-C-methyl-D-erythritol 2,4-cyclodiphosphate synthase
MGDPAVAPRSGIGFDVHRFAPGRGLWLAGVRFDGDGLAGHSDGDVVCHAIADALLGAAALGDVGQYFPDTDPSVGGISGPALLGQTVAILAQAGLAPSSCDATVVCDRPVIAPRRDEMRARLADVLGLSIDRVSVKATRPEGLGLVGDGVGCLAIVVVM